MSRALHFHLSNVLKKYQRTLPLPCEMKRSNKIHCLSRIQLFDSAFLNEPLDVNEYPVHINPPNKETNRQIKTFPRTEWKHERNRMKVKRYEKLSEINKRPMEMFHRS